MMMEQKTETDGREAPAEEVRMPGAAAWPSRNLGRRTYFPSKISAACSVAEGA